LLVAELVATEKKSLGSILKDLEKKSANSTPIESTWPLLR